MMARPPGRLARRAFFQAFHLVTFRVGTRLTGRSVLSRYVETSTCQNPSVCLSDSFKYTGYVDTNTYEIGLSVSVLGIHLGNIFGNLKDGVDLHVNLHQAAGLNRIYLKNGNELWTHLDIKVKFDGHFEGDYKILSV
jgi:hypothetical protein